MNNADVITVSEYLGSKFITYPFDGSFKDSLGYPETNFTALIYGKPKNGKTSFCVQLAKYMAQFTSVLYNSAEEGFSKSLKDAIKRERLNEVKDGLILFSKYKYDALVEFLERDDSPNVVVIDSRDYMNLSKSQFAALKDKFENKAFLITCWAEAGKPRGQVAQAMEYMVDIVIHVKNHIAHPTSRFGGNMDYVIWDKEQTKAKNNKSVKAIELHSIWKEIPHAIEKKGKWYYLSIEKNEDETYTALYRTERGKVLYCSNSHFYPHLALSDLRFKIKK